MGAGKGVERAVRGGGGGRVEGSGVGCVERGGEGVAWLRP